MVRVALLQPNVATPMGGNDAYQREQQLPNADAQLAQQVGQAAQAVAGAAQTKQYVDEMQKRQDAAAWSANTTSNATLTWQRNMKDRMMSAGPGAASFTDNFLQDFDEYKAAQLAQAPNAESREYLNRQLTSLRTTLGTQAIAFEGSEHVKWRENQIDQATDNATQVVFNDPSQRDNALKGVLDPIDAMDMPASWKAERTRKITQSINLAAATSIAQSNPAAIVGQPGSATTAAGGGQPGGGFLQADSFVAKKEGGLLPSDTNQTPTNYGINQAANPDVNVKNLTPEQAAQIRKTRYWDAIHGDALSPQLQPVAYNFAIQAGVGAANNLLQKSGGDPAKFNDLAKDYYASIPPEKQQGYLAAWQKRSDEAYALGRSAPASADNPLLNSLPYQSRVQVVNMAKTAQEQQMAAGRARVEFGLQDRQAAAEQGIVDPNPLTPDVLARVYPPDVAAQKYQTYLDGQQLARDVSTVKGMPAADINNLVQARMPVAGPGYAQAQHDQQILANAAAHVMQQRTSDPAQYVSINSPLVKQAQAAFSANPTPENAQLYAQTSIAEQTRLGIPKPQLLTKQQATTLEDQFKANNGANADQVIQQQAQIWGSQWGTVFGQLKGIPPVAKVIGYLGDSVDSSTRQQILQASQVKIEDLKDGLVTANVTAASQALQQKSADFAKTMAYTVGGAQTFGALYDSAERLTYTYMRQGQSPSDAAANAFNNVMGKQFKVVGSARIPSQFDSDQVMQSAKTVLGGIDKLDLVTPPAPSGMKPSDVKTQYANNLKSNAMWVTAADGKGLVLFDPTSQTVVRTKDGTPVGGSFADLSTKKTVGVPTPNPFAPSAAGAPGAPGAPTADVQMPIGVM